MCSRSTSTATASPARQRATSCSPHSRPRTGCAPNCSRTTPVAGSVALEDLGHAPTLADKLLGNDARAAERALLSYSRSLGRLHATTAGREADFDALQRRLTVPDFKDPLSTVGATALNDLPALLEAEIGVSTSAAVLECAERSRKLLETGHHRAFSPSDSCPDNNLITNRGVRFLDLEGGCVRNAIFDAAYLRVPFPSCWCPFGLPNGMTDAMLAGWRAEVRAMWPDLDDDGVVLPMLLDAQLFWVWLTTWQFFSGRRPRRRTRRCCRTHRRRPMC